MATEGLTRAGLARRLGVSRARVTQMLHLLELTPQAVSTIIALGNPLPMQVITERALRLLVGLAAREQRRGLERLIDRRREYRQQRKVDLTTSKDAVFSNTRHWCVW